MIRHITTIKAYESIMKDGYIKPRNKEGRDKGVISFEKYEGNNAFVAIFSKPCDSKFVGIFIDEQRLIDEGFNICSTDSTTLENRQLSKHTTKYENVTRFNGNEMAKEYKEIGEYVHVYGKISIKYIENVEFY